MTTTTSQESTALLGTEPLHLTEQADLLQGGRHNRPQTVSKRSIWSSIRFKATLLAVAIGTIPVFGIGAAAYYFANESITEQVTLTQKEQSVEIMDKVGRFMFDRYNDIQVLADLPYFRDPKLRASTTTAEKQAVLDKFSDTYQLYDSIGVFDLKGNVIWQTSGPTLTNHFKQDFFQEILKTDQPAIGNPAFSKDAKKVVMRFASPIKDAVSGKTLNIVRDRMPLDRLEEAIANFKNTGNKYYVFDAKGKIFVASDKQKIGTNVLEEIPGLSQARDTNQPTTFLAKFRGSQAEQLVSYAPFKKIGNTPDLKWGVAFYDDTADAFKSQQQLLLTLAVGTGITALLVGILAAWIANRVTRPIQEATDAVEKLGQGELDIRVQTKGNDEFAVLGTNINQMADRIQTLLGNLQESSAQIQHQSDLVAQDSEVLQSDVSHILDVVSALEDGDLTVQAEVSDRATGLVSDTLNRTIEQLGQVLGQVFVAAKQVSTRSSELEGLAKTVADNALAQAKEAAQVVNLTKQVEESAQSSGEKVDRANQSLLSMQSTVEEGQGALDTMNQGISVLQEGTDRIVQQMKALGEFVGLAEQFVQDQSQIASLTQVLSLNATLVAARASEQRDPRQFMVVAREFEAIANQVSNLAQQTNDGLLSLQQRTSQINTVVSTVDAEVQNLGGLVSGFTTGVDRSNEVFGNVRTVTVQVVQAGRSVAQSNQEIVNAAQQTAKAMGDIANLAERTAQLTKSTQAQIEQMESLSSQLLGSIQYFRLPASDLQAHEEAAQHFPEVEGDVLDIKFEATNAKPQAADVAKLEPTTIS